MNYSIACTSIAPTLTSVNPTAGEGGTVTLTGAGFYGTSLVWFGGQIATSYTVNSDTSITATVPSGSGTVVLGVKTDAGTTSASTVTYTYVVPTITLSALPSSSYGAAYNASVSASGGVAPYTYALSAGILPPGLTLTTTDGTVAGAPTTVGTFNFTIIAKDTFNFTGHRDYSVTITMASSATTLQSSINPTVFGQRTALTATIASANTAPDGTVAFSEGGTALPGCSAVSVSGAAAQCQISSLAVGAHSIVATYSGDGITTSGSTSTALSQTVNKASTTTMLTSPGPITLGNAVSVSASAAIVAPGAGTLSGSIAISDGGSAAGDSCTITLPATSCSLTPSAAGSKTLTATYTPDAAASAGFTGSSASGSVTVNAAMSGTALASTANPSVFGQSVTFTAKVTPATGNPVPTGSVNFTDGATAVCSGVALSGGQATCTTAALAFGSHPIQASYGGDTNTAKSSATLTQTVNKLTATVGLTSSANPSQQGTWVTFTATVSAAVAPASAPVNAQAQLSANAMAQTAGSAQAIVAAPTGTVTFTDGSTPLGTITLSNGTATFPAPFTVAGNHTITANYSGDAVTAAASFSIVQVVGAADAAVPAPMLDRWASLLLGGLLGLGAFARVRRARD